MEGFEGSGLCSGLGLRVVFGFRVVGVQKGFCVCRCFSGCLQCLSLCACLCVPSFHAVLTSHPFFVPHSHPLLPFIPHPTPTHNSTPRGFSLQLCSNTTQHPPSVVLHVCACHCCCYLQLGWPDMRLPIMYTTHHPPFLSAACAVCVCRCICCGQLGWPDMRLPIMYTMSWPERVAASEVTWPRLDFSKANRCGGGEFGLGGGSPFQCKVCV